MYDGFSELPGFTAIKQNGLYIGIEDPEEEEEIGGKNTTGGTFFHPKDGGSRFPPRH